MWKENVGSVRLVANMSDSWCCLFFFPFPLAFGDDGQMLPDSLSGVSCAFRS